MKCMTLNAWNDKKILYLRKSPRLSENPRAGKIRQGHSRPWGELENDNSTSNQGRGQDSKLGKVCQLFGKVLLIKFLFLWFYGKRETLNGRFFVNVKGFFLHKGIKTVYPPLHELPQNQSLQRAHYLNFAINQSDVRTVLVQHAARRTWRTLVLRERRVDMKNH